MSPRPPNTLAAALADEDHMLWLEPDDADCCIAGVGEDGECDCWLLPCRPEFAAKSRALDADKDEVGRMADGARRAKAASCGDARRTMKFVPRRSTADDMWLTSVLRRLIRLVRRPTPRRFHAAAAGAVPSSGALVVAPSRQCHTTIYFPI